MTPIPMHSSTPPSTTGVDPTKAAKLLESSRTTAELDFAKTTTPGTATTAASSTFAALDLATTTTTEPPTSVQSIDGTITRLTEPVPVGSSQHLNETIIEKQIDVKTLAMKNTNNRSHNLPTNERNLTK